MSGLVCYFVVRVQLEAIIGVSFSSSSLFSEIVLTEEDMTQVKAKAKRSGRVQGEIQGFHDSPPDLPPKMQRKIDGIHWWSTGSRDFKW